MDNLAVSAASNAASLFNSPAERATQSLRLADASVRTQASRAAAQAGAGAISTTQLNYTVGPDGQLYATSAVISTSQRTRGADDTALPNGQNLPPAQPLSLANIQPTRAGLTPSDEAIVFGSPEFLEETLGSNAGQVRARLQLTDFGVRAQESQHLRAAAGLGSAPQYTYQVGPDGRLYAVAGEVGIATGAAVNAQDAAADAATVARAALAATDVSAQDISVAREAQSRAAGLYAAAFSLNEQETPRLQLAA